MEKWINDSIPDVLILYQPKPTKKKPIQDTLYIGKSFLSLNSVFCLTQHIKI